MLLARTAAHLRPGQVAHRARLRAQRSALRRWPEAGRRLCAGPDPAAAVGWPVGYSPLDARMGQQAPGLAELQRGQDPAPRDHQGARRRSGLAACRCAAAVALPPALLGLGLGPGQRPRPGGRPGSVRAAVAILAGGGGASAAAMPGFPTPRRSAPGRGAGCTVTWWLAATSSPASYGELAAAHRVPATAISNPMSAATTWSRTSRRWPGWPCSSPTAGCCAGTPAAEQTAGRASAARRRSLRAGTRIPLPGARRSDRRGRPACGPADTCPRPR